MSTHADPTPIMQRDPRSGSFEAALHQTKGKRAELYAGIMRSLAQDAQTDEQLEANLRGNYGLTVTPSGVRSRRNELVLAGWVTELRDKAGVPVKRRNRYGSPCQVWRVVEPGEDHTPPKPRATGPRLGDTNAPEHEAGLAAARRWADWNVGDASWADSIIAAYLSPAETQAKLTEEGAS